MTLLSYAVLRGTILSKTILRMAIFSMNILSMATLEMPIDRSKLRQRTLIWQQQLARLGDKRRRS